MDRFLNLEIMAHPLNWVTVFLMCALALMLLALISPAPAGSPPETLPVTG